jgi:peptidoglycan/LPS O-acetylase OafA/YrhL
MMPSNTTLPRHQIAELESIRGLAALLVALFHAPGWYPQKEFIPIIANGYLMVDLFFVISGFVIYRAYAHKIQTSHEFWHFQFLRFGRLYPVHICILIFMLWRTAIPFLETNWDALIQQIFLIQAIGPWGHPISFNFPAWSISVEFYTYALFGLIILYAKKWSWLIFIALAVFSLIFLDPNKTQGLNQLEPGYSQILRCWAGFFMGAIVAGIVNRVNWRWSTHTVSLSMAALICFLQFKPNGKFDPLIYLITLILIMSLSLSPFGRVKAMLLLSPLKWLGKVSYSLYMVQLVAIGIAWDIFQHHSLYRFSGLNHLEAYMGISFQEPSTPISMVICYTTYIAILLIASWFLYSAVEKPFRQASRKIVSASKLIAP